MHLLLSIYLRSAWGAVFIIIVVIIHVQKLLMCLQSLTLLFLVFCLFRATPMTYGSSQARGQIGATATATWDPSRVCDLQHRSWQGQILNPRSDARDRTCISWILVGFVTAGPRWELQGQLTLFIYLFIFYFPTVQQGDQVIPTCILRLTLNMKRHLECNFKKQSWSSWEQKSYQVDILLSLSFLKAASVNHKKSLNLMTKKRHGPLSLDYTIKV